MINYLISNQFKLEAICVTDAKCFIWYSSLGCSEHCTNKSEQTSPEQSYFYFIHPKLFCKN